jgi:hypothetical protein
MGELGGKRKAPDVSASKAPLIQRPRQGAGELKTTSHRGVAPYGRCYHAGSVRARRGEALVGLHEGGAEFVELLDFGWREGALETWPGERFHEILRANKLPKLRGIKRKPLKRI